MDWLYSWFTAETKTTPTQPEMSRALPFTSSDLCKARTSLTSSKPVVRRSDPNLLNDIKRVRKRLRSTPIIEEPVSYGRRRYLPHHPVLRELVETVSTK